MKNRFIIALFLYFAIFSAKAQDKFSYQLKYISYSYAPQASTPTVEHLYVNNTPEYIYYWSSKGQKYILLREVQYINEAQRVFEFPDGTRYLFTFKGKKMKELVSTDKNGVEQIFYKEE